MPPTAGTARPPPATRASHADGAGRRRTCTPTAGCRVQGGIFIGPDNHVIETAHEAPTWVKALALHRHAARASCTAWVMYIRRPGPAGASWPRANRPLYLFLLNKWYFDEIYDAIFVRPAVAFGRFLWRRGDGNVIDGTINGVAMGIIPFFTRLAGRGAVRLPVPLRLRHGDRHRRPRHLDDAQRRGALMDNLLSIITFMPLVAALVLAVFLRGDDEAAQRNAKWLALIGDRRRPSWSRCSCWPASTPSNTGFQFVEERAVDPRAELQDGRRRHLGAVRDADDLPDAADHRAPAGTSRRGSRNT